MFWCQYAISPSDLHYSLTTTSKVILFGIRRVVIGENTTFIGNVFTQSPRPRNLHSLVLSHIGGEDILISRGVEIVNLDSTECKDLMAKLIRAKPEVWNEDIGEE